MTVHLSESLEDYLEVIAELIEGEGHAHSKEIAEKLNVKMPSVTGALRQLEKLGYIIYNTHYPVQLTENGRKIAEQVRRRHSILKKFFSEILCLPIEKASETACHLEHIVDEDTIRRFILFSEAIENRCDAKKLQIYLTEAMKHFEDPELTDLRVLSECTAGCEVTMEKAGRNLGEKAIAFASGQRITIVGMTLDRTAFKVCCDGVVSEIPLEVAENIWVR